MISTLNIFDARLWESVGERMHDRLKKDEINRKSLVSLLNYITKEVMQINPTAAYIISLGSSMLSDNTIDNLNPSLAGERLNAGRMSVRAGVKS